MNPASSAPFSALPALLCGGRDEALVAWLERAGTLRSLAASFTIISAGVGAYGFSVGCWHGATMGGYLVVKLPLVIFLTVACNGVLNGMLAAVLGSGLGFLQTAQAILLGFTTFALITGSLSLASVFLTLHFPRSTTVDDAAQWWHAVMLVFHTVVIAYAGLLANVKLLRLLVLLCADSGAALRTFFAWTIGNLFVGAQIAWVLRPWFLSPGTEMVFLRPDPMHSNFYESFWLAVQGITVTLPDIAWPFIGLAAVLTFAFSLKTILEILQKKPAQKPTPP